MLALIPPNTPAAKITRQVIASHPFPTGRRMDREASMIDMMMLAIPVASATHPSQVGR